MEELLKQARLLVRDSNFVYISQQHSAILVTESETSAQGLLKTYPDLFDVKKNSPVTASKKK